MGTYSQGDLKKAKELLELSREAALKAAEYASQARVIVADYYDEWKPDAQTSQVYKHTDIAAAASASVAFNCKQAGRWLEETEKPINLNRIATQLSGEEYDEND